MDNFEEFVSLFSEALLVALEFVGIFLLVYFCIRLLGYLIRRFERCF